MTEWKTYRLGDIAKFQTGKLNSNAAVENGKYPFFTCSPNTLAIDNYAFDKEAILLAGNNAEGNFSIKYYKGKFNAYQRTYIIETYNDKCDIKFLFYALKLCLQQFKLMSQGTSTKFLTAVILNNFEISLPPLAEQRRIAGILGAIDDKIENNRRINTNLELQAQALYKQWFVDNRKDDWKVGKVSDYYDITIGKTPPRKEKQWFSNNPKDSVWVSISDLGSCGAYISDSSEYLTAEAVKKFNIKVIPNNAVLLSFKLTVGRVAITDGVLTTNEAIAHFNTLNDYITEYTYLALKAYNFANLGSTSSIATAVNSKIIKAMPWVMPNDDVLRDFHNIVAPLFAQIKNNIRENETLATLRDTLLPKLMNGEIKM